MAVHSDSAGFTPPTVFTRWMKTAFVSLSPPSGPICGPVTRSNSHSEIAGNVGRTDAILRLRCGGECDDKGHEQNGSLP